MHINFKYHFVLYTMANVLTQGCFRLFCALEGKYMVQEATHELTDSLDSFKEHDEQCINFHCSIPVSSGRGFIEVLFSYKYLACMLLDSCRLCSKDSIVLSFSYLYLCVCKYVPKRGC